MQKIARVLGRDEDSEKYRVKREEISHLINTRLYDPAKHIYGSGSQIDLTFPLLSGVAPDSVSESVRKNLINEIKINHNGHIACGLVGIPVFTEWAVKNRQVNLMYSMLKKRDYPGYLYMIDNGATTTWEHWNGARSRIHNCYNGVGSWFYQAVGGIIPDEKYPGYSHFIIDPQIPEGVTWAKISKETPYGTVSVNWQTGKDIFSMELDVPPGSTARVIIPEVSEKVTVNGKSPEVTGNGFDISGGKYTVEWQYKR
jgi:alpha-L-rhamnosidase